jgi:hypothetical protein
MNSDSAKAPDNTDYTDLEAPQVEQYLRNHPAFLRHRPDLLSELELPHGDTGAVSLVERQVSLLRERNIDSRQRLALLQQTASANDALFEATRAMSLDVLSIRSVPALSKDVPQLLKKYFRIDFAALLWLADTPAALQGTSQATPEVCDKVGGLLRRHHALSGTFRDDEMSTLFGAPAITGSAAVAPLLLQDKLIGALAVGSKDPHRYQSDDGTLFLQYVADIIVRLVVLLDHTARE